MSDKEIVKRPKNPLSVGKFFLGILLFLILVFIAVYTTLFIMTESFDFVAVSKDMGDKLGITKLFTQIAGWFK